MDAQGYRVEQNVMHQITRAVSLKNKLCQDSKSSVIADKRKIIQLGKDKEAYQDKIFL